MQPLYILTFCVALTLLGILTLRQPLKAYRRKRKYEKIVQQIHQLFAYTDPFLASQDERKITQQPDLYYGEMNICAFLDMLAIIAPKPNSVLIDLGSGCGKLIIAAKLAYPSLQLRGIEVLKSLHQMSELKYQEMVNQCSLPNANGVTFLCADFMEQSISDADIIFLNATGYTDESFKPVLDKLLTAKPNAKIIITSKQLPADQFKKHYQGMERTSWGLTSTFIFEKI